MRIFCTPSLSYLEVWEICVLSYRVPVHSQGLHVDTNHLYSSVTICRSWSWFRDCVSSRQILWMMIIAVEYNPIRTASSLARPTEARNKIKGSPLAHLHQLYTPFAPLEAPLSLPHVRWSPLDQDDPYASHVQARICRPVLFDSRSVMISKIYRTQLTQVV